MRATTKDLEGAFLRLTRDLGARGVDTTSYALSRWQPGDGVRWRIESDGGARTPLGATYRSTSEMLYSLYFACNAVELIEAQS